MLFIPLLAVAVLVLILLVPVLSWTNRDGRGWPFWPVFLLAGALLALLRVGCYWFLLYLEAARQQSHASALLTILLLPEGAIMTPNVAAATLARKLFFSGLLTASSFLWAAVVAWPQGGVRPARERRYKN